MVAILQLHTDDDIVLRQRSQDVSISEINTPEFIEFAENLANTLANHNGVGLAAPQVGVLKRVIVIRENQLLRVMVNPVITKTRKMVTHKKERCLSFPTKSVDMDRYKFVTVTYLDLQGQQQVMKYHGLEAFCVQHEIDHLNGIVLGDLV